MSAVAGSVAVAALVVGAGLGATAGAARVLLGSSARDSPVGRAARRCHDALCLWTLGLAAVGLLAVVLAGMTSPWALAGPAVLAFVAGGLLQVPLGDQDMRRAVAGATPPPPAVSPTPAPPAGRGLRPTDGSLWADHRP